MNAHENIDQPTYTLLAVSKNGVKVLYDPQHSHAATHFDDTPNLKDLTIEVVESLKLEGDEINTHFNMGRVVGTCDVVSIDDTDEIIWGMRKNRADDGHVPFTTTRDPKPSQNVAVSLLPQDDGAYILSSAWIGTFDQNDPPFPQSPGATDESVRFWSERAFVYGSQEIVPGTETSTYPW